MFANMTRSSIALAAALGLGLALSACAHNNPDNPAAGAGGGYGVSGPGSVQEFNQTVGDRVFFTTDQTDLSSTAQATLDKQAAWLNQYNKYSFTIEGHADERGTREYNFALGSRRAQALKATQSTSAAASAVKLRVMFANILPLLTTPSARDLAALRVNARFR